jgi:hypothetical protein
MIATECARPSVVLRASVCARVLALLATISAGASAWAGEPASAQPSAPIATDATSPPEPPPSNSVEPTASPDARPASNVIDRLVVPPGPGQGVLVVEKHPEGVTARVCPSAAPCDSPATVYRVRASIARAPLGFESIELEGGKRVALATMRHAGRVYRILVASRSRTGGPTLLHAGWDTDASGSREVALTLLAKADLGPKGSDPRAIGIETRAKLCGEKLLVSTERLDPKKLELVTTAGPDPLSTRRASATALEAARLDARPAAFALATASSSSTGAHAALTDGDPSTAWREQAEGAGAGSFVDVAVPKDVPLLGVDLTIAPAASPAPNDRAPRTLSVVTSDRTFVVTLPDDALASGGATYRVTFPEPIRSSCASIVLGDAHLPTPTRASKGAVDDPQVVVSELSVRTSLDGTSLEELARGLGGSAVDLATRLAVLARSPMGTEAVVGAYGSLDGLGKERARKLLDGLGCDASLPLHVADLLDRDAELSGRARARLRRCGDAIVEPLVAMASSREGSERAALFEEAAAASPARAVPLLLASLGAKTDASSRSALRRALAKAALRSAGVRAIDAVVARDDFARLPLATRVDVLRAIGEGWKTAPNARGALRRIDGEINDFGAEYRWISVLGDAARGGDDFAREALGTRMRASDERLRARAVRSASSIGALRPALAAAIDDPSPRVREAAFEALSSSGAVGQREARRAVAQLAVEPWTFVRRAAVGVALAAPDDEVLDAELARAMSTDPSPEMRAHLARTLGSRRALGGAEALVELASDRSDFALPRRAAVEALGAMCASESARALADLVELGSHPELEDDLPIAMVSLGALASIGPSGLEQLLEPALSERAPPPLRDEAAKALRASNTSHCRGGKPAPSPAPPAPRSAAGE